VSQKGKTQLLLVIVAPVDQEAEGDRLFRSHQTWMEATHHRTGEKALLSYNVSKAPQVENPMDPASKKTGKICFVLNEVYESDAGPVDHMQQAAAWTEFPALGEWLKKCTIVGVTSARIFNSLW
jgi:hypothetical protein